MSAQRFIGANSREAMNQVRLVLGEEALILSSRMTEQGVEIMALAAIDDEPVPVSLHHAANAYAQQIGALAPAPIAHAVAPGPLPAGAGEFAALSERLLSEIQGMRQLIDRQTPPSAKGPGSPDRLLKWLLDAGFSASLSADLLGTAQPQLQGPDATPARLQAWLAQKLDSQLNQLSDEDEFFDSTRILALVGPTGVGKTTTTAKLAARYVMRHGARQVALVSTDSFRVGAHEQLNIYAQLLGVELHTLGPAAALEPLLEALADKRLVIIDTVGMSQRDQRLLTQINQLGSSGRALRLMLVLNAASHGDTLDEVVQSYRDAALAAGCRLDDCIISKCDEAARLAPALDTVIRHGLRLNYLSVGQQVPEDLQLPGASTLLQQALDISRPSLFAAKPGVSTPQRLDALVRGLLGQNRTISSLRDSLTQQIPGFVQLLEVWPLMGMPAVLQQQRWAAFLCVQERWAAAKPNGVLLWGAPGPKAGASWSMPLLATDDAGQLQASPWLIHRLPIGPKPRLSWCQPRWPKHRHVWSTCPNGETLDALRHNGQSWLSAVKASQRVMYQGEHQALGTLATHAEAFGATELKYRRRDVRLSLSHLPVLLKGSDQDPLYAWFGTLQDNHSGQCLGQRWWLAGQHPQRALKDQVDDLCLQLKHDELAKLTNHAWSLLIEIQPRLHAELRLYLACGLAATAVRLSNANDDWAFQARAQLLALLPKKRARHAWALLEGLLHMLTVSDAFCQIDSRQPAVTP